MQRKRAGELRKLWGEKECGHPELGREYDLGARTGNYVCSRCGKVFTFREKTELLAVRSPEPPAPRRRPGS
jgi:hypothetical protein